MFAGKKTVCYLDMDGVLADFVSQVRLTTGFDVQGFRNRELSQEEKNIQKNVFHYVDTDKEFWKNMPKLKDADKLVAFCLSHFDEVKILSTYRPPKENPARFIEVRKDKIRWIRSQFPNQFKIEDILVTQEPKHLHIKPEKINYLVDDTTSEIKEWNANGGIGFLYTGYDTFANIFNRTRENNKCR